MGRRDKQARRRHLGEEIIEEILSRLQVKSLLRFQSVSKSWSSLIGSERFIKAHLQNSRENADLANHRVIYDYLPDLVFPSRREGAEVCELKQYSVHSLMNDPVPNPSGLEHVTDFGVVGCCNGVVCVRDPDRSKRSFYLWNPATRIWIELPKLERELYVDRSGMGWDMGFIIRTGFGWDEYSGAYKVFVFLNNTSIDVGLDRCIVYSSNTNKWERVETDFYWGVFCAREEGVLVNGKLHWHRYVGEEVVIVSLDLKSAVIEIMEHPVVEGRELYEQCVSLGVVGGCLSEVQHQLRELDVWVMKEYGVKESWFRAIAVDLEDFIGPYPYYAPYNVKPFSGIANLLGGGPEGEILISYEYFFLVYHPKKDTITMVSRLDEIKSGARAHIYFETLLSPPPNATPLPSKATLKNRLLSFIYFCLARLL